MVYQAKGYFTAHVIDHTREHSRRGRPRRFKIPLLKPNKPGKRADVTMVVDEGQKYYLRNFNFVG